MGSNYSAPVKNDTAQYKVCFLHSRAHMLPSDVLGLCGQDMFSSFTSVTGLGIDGTPRIQRIFCVLGNFPHYDERPREKHSPSFANFAKYSLQSFCSFDTLYEDLALALLLFADEPLPLRSWSFCQPKGSGFMWSCVLLRKCFV